MLRIALTLAFALMLSSTLSIRAAAANEQVGKADASAGLDWSALAWKKGTASPFARVESPTVVIDDKLYLFGGFRDDLSASNQLDVYDPANDAWARLKEMPTQVTHLNPALDGKTVWLAGGFKGKHPGPVTAEVWKYDVASDTWTAGPALPEPRAGGGLDVVGRKLHYFGGFKDRNAVSRDHWSLSLDGGNAWEREADLPEPRGHVSVAVLDGKLYALGGTNGHDVTQVDYDFCHRFDPATKSWTQIAKLPDPRSHFESSTIIHKGQILIFGGRCNNSKPPKNLMNDVLAYDPATDAWREVGKMPEGLMTPSAAIVGQQIVVTSGGLNSPLPLTAKTWTAPLPGAQQGRAEREKR